MNLMDFLMNNLGLGNTFYEDESTRKFRDIYDYATSPFGPAGKIASKIAGEYLSPENDVMYAEDYVSRRPEIQDVGYRKNPAFDQQMSLIDARHEALANRNRTIPNEYEYSSEWVDVPVREGVWDSPAPGVEVQRKSGGPVYGTGFDPPQTVPGGSFSAAESTVPGATWTAEDELISKLKDATRPSMGRYRDASGRVQWGYSPEVEAKAREDFINLYNSYKANEAANLRSMSRAGSDQLGVLLDIEDFNRKISNDQFNRENTMYEREFDAYKLDREEKSKLLLARAKNAIDMFNADDMMKADPKMRALINKYISANTLEEQDSIEEEINKYLNAGDETEAPQAVTPRSYIGDVLGR